METNFRGKIGKIGDLLSFVVITFRHGLQYRNTDFKRLNDINFSASCRNLVRIGPVTPVFTLLK